MGRIAKGINKVTGTVIGVSGRLILLALIILLLVEGMSRGYAFGYDIFHPTAMEEAPGTDISVTIPEDQSDSETAAMLEDVGLIANRYAMMFQLKFYEYEIYPGTYQLNTAMTSKEILRELNEKPAEETDS
ncbi:MAG: endolytic transglycosylase MltG [Clostridiales bacterium]|nr:endolytic transglycosylase MltG [Clostridiales bacterium]